MSFHTNFGSTLSYNLCFQSPKVRMEEETQKKNQKAHLFVLGIFSAKEHMYYYK